ncbi:hypothetical protein ACP275_14G281500 [Erythranthe tilingii]
MDDDSEKMDDDREKMDNGSEKSNGEGIQSSSPEKQQQYLTTESSEIVGRGSAVQTEEEYASLCKFVMDSQVSVEVLCQSASPEKQQHYLPMNSFGTVNLLHYLSYSLDLGFRMNVSGCFPCTGKNDCAVVHLSENNLLSLFVFLFVMVFSLKLELLFTENGAGSGSAIQTVGNLESNGNLEAGDLDITDYDIDVPVFSVPEDWKNEEEALGAASFTGLAVNQHNAELDAAAQHLQPALRQPDAVEVLRQQPCSAMQQLDVLMEEGLVTKAELHILQVAVGIGQKANRMNLRQPFAVEVLGQQPCPAMQQVAVIKKEALVSIPELIILDEAVRIGHRVNRRKRRLLMWERGLGHGP